MNAITMYPSNQSQYDILVSLAREMKMRFSTSESDLKSEFLSSLCTAAREAKKIAAGEVKAESLDDLLAEA